MMILNNDVNFKKLKYVFKDGEFVKRLISMKTAEEVQQELEKRRALMTLDEIVDLGKEMNNISHSIQDKEVSDDDLELVCGGKGTLRNLALTAIIAVFAYDVYNRYNDNNSESYGPTLWEKGVGTTAEYVGKAKDYFNSKFGSK